MAEFLAAIAVFFAAHAIPPMPPVRMRLIAWFGWRAYLAGYSAASLALIAWIISAARRAPYLSLWDAAPWQALVPLAVMPFSVWLLFAGLTEPNPLSISLRAAGPDHEAGSAGSVTRHPVLWGLLLWSGSHIPPNGDVVSLILFGGFALLALGGFVIVDRRSRRRLGEERWRELAARAPLLPFAGIFTGRTRMKASLHLLLSMAAALSAYLWFLLQGHEMLIGADPLAWFSL